MKTVTTEQIQELDRVAIETHGVASLDLMENAGKACTDEILKSSPSKVTVVCGLGNNGGDGFVIARQLKSKGVAVDVFVVGDALKFSPDAKTNYAKIKGKVTFVESAIKPLITSLEEADVVVDAIFGVGLYRDIKDPFKSVIEAINVHAQKVFAVDIPSGLNGTTGEIYGVCVQAEQTVTFTFIKEGMARSTYGGEITVADIGIPGPLKEQICP